MPEDGIEKKLKEITGASISQIRAAALGTPLRDALTRAQSNAPPPQSFIPPLPQIEYTEQSLGPNPLTLGASQSEAAQGPASGGSTFDAEITENAQLVIYRIVGTYQGVAPP